MSVTTPHRFVRPRKDRHESGAVWLQLAAALLGGLLLFMAVLFTLSMGYSILYFGRIFPGVSVAGVDLSGMTEADAAVKLSNTLTYPYSGRIVFRDGASVWIETPARLGMIFDAAATANQALSLGRSWNLFQNTSDQVNALQGGLDLPPVSIFDQRSAHAYLQDLARKVDRPVAEASLNINGLDVTAQPGQAGRTVNVDSTLISLNAQLQSFRDGEVPLVVAEQAPEIADSSVQAEAARRLLSAPFTLSIPDARPGDPGPWQIEPNELASMLRVGRVAVGSSSQFALQLEPDAIQNVLDQIAQQVDRRSENARFIFNDKTGQIDLLQPAIIGLTMDVSGSMKQVEAAVAQGQQNVLLDIAANQPQVGDDATAQQLGITENIQTYTSYFRGSSAARLQNIKAAAAKFHGLLIAPGATFSMGEYVGDISLDNGFAEAMIIYNGQTIKGVGGGVCQVSTTLFRTAFLAGFPINERHAHAYRVFYYEQTAGGIDPDLAGLDATVYFPLVNFKFTNDTSHWLLMETYFGPNSYSLTWKFYSTKDGRTVNWETTGPQNIVPAPDPVIQINPEFSEGEIKHVDYAAQGADVVVNRIVMRDGKILFADKFVTQYQPWADVCEYGPGTKNPEKQLKKKGLCQR
jgi:vancomycin resistance protein YoaR